MRCDWVMIYNFSHTRAQISHHAWTHHAGRWVWHQFTYDPQHQLNYLARLLLLPPLPPLLVYQHEIQKARWIANRVATSREHRGFFLIRVADELSISKHQKATHNNLTWRYHIAIARTEERKNWRQKSAPFSVDFLHGIFWLNLSFATRAALKSAGGPWVHSDNWARLLTGAAAVSQCMCIVLGQISSTNPLRLKACTVAPRTRWWEYSEFFVF